MIRVLSLGLLLFSLVASPLQAITPEEQLSDPILEERARDLSAQLRCLVCQNQSIEDSDAELAVDLRKEVRQKLEAGLDDAAILQSLQDTYGDYILLRPPVSPETYLLWATPAILILMAGLLFVVSFRSRPPNEETDASNTQTGDADPVPADESFALSPRMVGIIAFGILLTSFGLYSYFGSPDITAKPLEGRSEERAAAIAKEAQQASEFQAQFIEAQAQAAKAPNSVEAQMRYALAAAQLNDYPTEIGALRRALTLTDGNPSIKAMLAEAMSRQADGQIILPARALIDEVLAAYPEEPRALFMKGLAAYQDEDFEKALSVWQELQSVAPPNTPWGPLALQNMQSAAEAAGIAMPAIAPPLDEDVLAEMAEADEETQADMILSMVASLEERLADNPNDRQGWQRLVRAMRVLGDDAGLLRALTGAAAASPLDRNAQLELLEEMLGRGKSREMITAAEESLARLKALDPDALEYLFFAGHLARLQGKPDEARRFWQALSAQLPDDTPFKAQLEAQITALQQ